jgi:hypothetical protein
MMKKGSSNGTILFDGFVKLERQVGVHFSIDRNDVAWHEGLGELEISNVGGQGFQAIIVPGVSLAAGTHRDLIVSYSSLASRRGVRLGTKILMAAKLPVLH